MKKLRAVKEKEIHGLEERIKNELKNQFENLKLSIDNFEQEKEELKEKEQQLDLEIETKTNTFRQKKELLSEIEKCESTDIAQLETEVTTAQEELDGLKA